MKRKRELVGRYFIGPEYSCDDCKKPMYRHNKWIGDDDKEYCGKCIKKHRKETE